MYDSVALWKKPSPQKNQLEVVLLIRQDAIGDFVMWLDTAKEYRKLYPADKYKIVLVGNKIWFDLAEKLPNWDEVLAVDVKRFKTFSGYRWNLLRKIHSLGAQIAIQPTFSREFYHGDSLVRASKATRKISSVGDMGNRNWLKKFIADSWHTELIPVSTRPMTELERNAEFFSGLSNYSHITGYPQLDIPELWLPSGWREKIFYILVPGTSRAVDGKEWPPSFFSDIGISILYIKTHAKAKVSGVIKGTIVGSSKEVIFIKSLISKPFVVTYSMNFKDRISHIKLMKKIVIYIKYDPICLKI